ncbi:Uncharacterised protein [Klebsiella pneumoniae]|nr:Uncharacterised protein [Klebsiella pneumoniae]
MWAVYNMRCNMTQLLFLPMAISIQPICKFSIHCRSQHRLTKTFQDLWDLLKTCFGAVYLRQQYIEFFGDDFLFGKRSKTNRDLPHVCLRKF